MSTFRIIQNRKLYFIFSGVLVAMSIVFMSIWGLRLGIDFTGGSLVEVEYSSDSVISDDVTQKLLSQGFNISSVQKTDNNAYLIRLEALSHEEHQRLLSELQELATGGETFKELRFDSIGPTIGSELKQKAIVALSVALIAIIFYIAWAFRKVSEPVASWKYGIGAIIALMHDVLIIAGIFVVLGYFLNVEIDALFVTALLTILGFSVHDTIVVYDRTRENLLKSTGTSFEDTVNRSVNETIARSVNTSVTTLFVLGSLYFLGGQSIQYFVLALILGIVVGTYSSIFIASPLLLVWERMKRK